MSHHLTMSDWYLKVTLQPPCSCVTQHGVIILHSFVIHLFRLATDDRRSCCNVVRSNDAQASSCPVVQPDTAAPEGTASGSRPTVAVPELRQAFQELSSALQQRLPLDHSARVVQPSRPQLSIASHSDLVDWHSTLQPVPIIVQLLSAAASMQRQLLYADNTDAVTSRRDVSGCPPPASGQPPSADGSNNITRASLFAPLARAPHGMLLCSIFAAAMHVCFPTLCACFELCVPPQCGVDTGYFSRGYFAIVVSFMVRTVHLLDFPASAFVGDFKPGVYEQSTKPWRCDAWAQGSLPEGAPFLCTRSCYSAPG